MADVTYGTVKEGLFQSALDFLKQTQPPPSKLYRELEEEARAKAFTVSGYTTMEILEQFLQELEAAIEQGTTKEEFRKKMNTFLEEKGYEGINPWKADVVYRTNLQTAYNAGHYKAMTDSTTRKSCGHTGSILLPVTGMSVPPTRPWKGRYTGVTIPYGISGIPRMVFRCRCGVISLTEEQVKRRGLPVESVMPHEIDRETGEAVFYWPDKGFSGNPAKTVWKPDMQSIRPDLQGAYQDTQKEKRR